MSKTQSVISPVEFGNGLGSLMAGIMAMYLLVGGNYLGQLVSCTLQSSLTSRIWFKHLIGFLTMYFSVMLVGRTAKTWSMWINFGMAAALYTLWLVTNRAKVQTQIASVILFAFIYVIENIKTSTISDIESGAPTEKIKDAVPTGFYTLLAGKNKEIITEPEYISLRNTYISTHPGGPGVPMYKYLHKGQYNFINALNIAQIVIFSVAMFFIFMGMLVYYGEKRIEYGPDFRFKHWFWGKVKCSNACAPRRAQSITNALKAIFYDTCTMPRLASTDPATCD